MHKNIISYLYFKLSIFIFSWISKATYYVQFYFFIFCLVISNLRHRGSSNKLLSLM